MGKQKIIDQLTLPPTGTGGPSEVREGKDALLTCVVMAPFYNDTIIWRRGSEILSAGMNRVTSDKRISILHEDCESPPPRAHAHTEVTLG